MRRLKFLWPLFWESKFFDPTGQVYVLVGLASWSLGWYRLQNREPKSYFFNFHGLCYVGVSLAGRLRHWFGSFLPKKSINSQTMITNRCFIVFIIQSFFFHEFCTNKTINFVEIKRGHLFTTDSMIWLASVVELRESETSRIIWKIMLMSPRTFSRRDWFREITCSHDALHHRLN